MIPENGRRKYNRLTSYDGHKHNRFRSYRHNLLKTGVQIILIVFIFVQFYHHAIVHEIAFNTDDFDDQYQKIMMEIVTNDDEVKESSVMRTDHHDSNDDDFDDVYDLMNAENGHYVHDKETTNLHDIYKNIGSYLDTRNTCTYDTVSCPCGPNTSPNYHQNMIHAYSHHDPNLVKKCFQLPLPLTQSDPIQCWPRIFIGASYPTSGNALTRQIFSKTFQMNYFMDQYKEHKRTAKDMFLITYPFKKAITAHCNQNPQLDDVDTHLPIPIIGKPVIFKSHGPKNWKHYHPSGKSNYSKPGGFLDGIIRLARNPGDHIIRNYGRFKYNNTGISEECYHSECFNKQGREFCDGVLEAIPDWVNYHQYWNTQMNDTKQIIYHYEHFSHQDHIVKATKKVIEFLDEIPTFDLKSLGDLIKPQSYKFGTLMMKTCGVEYARMLHNATKEVSLGYVFDYNSATWSLPDPI